MNTKLFNKALSRAKEMLEDKEDYSIFGSQPRTLKGINVFTLNLEFRRNLAIVILYGKQLMSEKETEVFNNFIHGLYDSEIKELGLASGEPRLSIEENAIDACWCMSKNNSFSSKKVKSSFLRILKQFDGIHSTICS